MSGFGKINLKQLQEEDTRVNSSEQTSFLDQFVPMPKPSPGKTATVTVRILPPIAGKNLFQYTRIHTINGRKVHDPKRLMNGKWDKTPNPILDFYNSLWRDADKAKANGRIDEAERLEAEARLIKPVERYYYNAIVRKMPEGDGINVGPRILSVGKVLHKMIIRAICGDEAEPALGDVTDPDTGFDFNIRVEVRGTGKDAFPNYDRSVFARESSPLGTPDEIARWMNNMHDLESLHKVTSVEDLERELAIHRGWIEDDRAGFDINALEKKYRNDNKIVIPQTSSPVVSKSTAPVTEENVNIDDDEFVRQIQAMQDDE